MGSGAPQDGSEPETSLQGLLGFWFFLLPSLCGSTCAGPHSPHPRGDRDVLASEAALSLVPFPTRGRTAACPQRRSSCPPSLGGEAPKALMCGPRTGPGGQEAEGPSQGCILGTPHGSEGPQGLEAPVGGSETQPRSLPWSCPSTHLLDGLGHLAHLWLQVGAWLLALLWEGQFLPAGLLEGRSYLLGPELGGTEPRLSTLLQPRLPNCAP